MKKARKKEKMQRFNIHLCIIYYFYFTSLSIHSANFFKVESLLQAEKYSSRSHLAISIVSLLGQDSFTTKVYLREPDELNKSRSYAIVLPWNFALAQFLKLATHNISLRFVKP
jgi:hypothetical protein